MPRRSSKQIVLGLAVALALGAGLMACETVDNGVDWVGSGAARGANWVSGTVSGADR
jgi:hypothetical protein